MGLLNNPSVRPCHWRHHHGFSLIEMLIVTALLGIVMAGAVPLLGGVVDAQRLGQATREVAHELQAAKQRAVANNRPMRVVFNCPMVNSYRAVELIGTTSDPVAADDIPNGDRCIYDDYPYPAADRDPVTRPNLDGPTRVIDSRLVFEAGVQTVEFWPDGTAHYDSGASPWGLISTSGLEITLIYGTKFSTIQVNGVGRIKID